MYIKERKQLTESTFNLYFILYLLYFYALTNLSVRLSSAGGASTFPLNQFIKLKRIQSGNLIGV